MSIRATFIKQFGYLLYPNPKDKKHPYKEYGLTPQEETLILSGSN